MIFYRGLSSWLFLILLVQAVHVRAGDVNLTTLSDCYALGATVSFTLTNNLESTIYMPNFPWWRIRDVRSGAMIAPSVAFDVIVPMSAGSAETYTWHQLDFNGNAVAPGSYQVEVSYYQQASSPPLLTVTSSFTISRNCPPTPTDPLTWGRVKHLFH